MVATLLAGPLVDLYAPTIHGPPGSHGAAEHHLMVVWAYFFIPQIFFYGMSSLIGAILNTRGRFAAPMWTPVINNLVVIVVGGLYVVIVHLGKEPWNIPAGGVQLLGIGTTLGVVAQTVALFPSLRARRVPLAAHARVPARRGDRDGPDGRLDVGLRGHPVGRQPDRPDRRERRPRPG